MSSPIRWPRWPGLPPLRASPTPSASKPGPALVVAIMQRRAGLFARRGIGKIRAMRLREAATGWPRAARIGKARTPQLKFRKIKTAAAGPRRDHCGDPARAAENGRDYVPQYLLAIGCLLAIAATTAFSAWIMRDVIDEIFYRRRADLIAVDLRRHRRRLRDPRPRHLRPGRGARQDRQQSRRALPAAAVRPSDEARRRLLHRARARRIWPRRSTRTSPASATCSA